METSQIPSSLRVQEFLRRDNIVRATIMDEEILEGIHKNIEMLLKRRTEVARDLLNCKELETPILFRDLNYFYDALNENIMLVLAIQPNGK